MKEELFLDQAILFPRHLQVFWNRSADLWQHLWDNFLEFAGKQSFISIKRVIRIYFAQLQARMSLISSYGGQRFIRS